MTALEQAQAILAETIQAWHTPEAGRLDATLTPDDLIPVVTTLNAHHWGYLVAITGLDHGPEAGHLEVLYHFCAGPEVLTLRVTLAREEAAVPSVCPVFPYASVFERELAEMFGIAVTGTPDPARLFLPDDWPEAVYPLRKDAELD